MYSHDLFEQYETYQKKLKNERPLKSTQGYSFLLDAVELVGKELLNNWNGSERLAVSHKPANEYLQALKTWNLPKEIPEAIKKPDESAAKRYDEVIDLLTRWLIDGKVNAILRRKATGEERSIELEPWKSEYAPLYFRYGSWKEYDEKGYCWPFWIFVEETSLKAAMKAEAERRGKPVKFGRGDAVVWRPFLEELDSRIEKGTAKKTGAGNARDLMRWGLSNGLKIEFEATTLAKKINADENFKKWKDA